MIPKIVYYCWFGNAKPINIQLRIEQWKEILSDYTFVEINEQNFNYEQYQFTADAYQAGKYAYVSDVARLDFLYETGGIYLDTDVDVLQSFEPFLQEEVLHLSMEYYGYEITGVNVGTILCPQHHPVIKHVRDLVIQSIYSEKRPTINVYFNRVLSDLKYKNQAQYFSDLKTRVYQTTVFCKCANQSVTVHQYDNSWGDKLSTKQKIKRMCGVFVKRILGRTLFEKIFIKEE
ncbi:MAG: glycosyltransferase family 32 protein [Culicoidibacterales bacterium]